MTPPPPPHAARPMLDRPGSISVLGLLLFVVVLAVDLRGPAGYAGAMAYIVPVLLGLWTRGRAYTLILAAAATIAAILARVGPGALGEVPGWLVWLNRATAVVAVWATALVVLRYKHARAAAENERAKSRAILETTVDALVSISDRGTIELFNRSAERMFGWRADEILGKNVALLMPSPQREAHDGYLERYRRTAERRVIGIGREVEAVRKDGSTFPIELALAEVPLEGRRIFTGIIRDISERREHERSREALLASLGEKNTELERFTYTVSHDLKSPLVTIKGFLGLLEQSVASGEPARVKSDLARIGAAADRMRQLLDELLELSRVGRVVGASLDVPLGELAREVKDALEGPLAARGASLEIAADLPVVRGDRLRLRQLLQNLVENAIKFGGEQPAPRIAIGAVRQEAEALAWVQDNGTGVEARYAEKIFGLFEKLDRKTEGTGVGLALVKRIAEVHGGRAWVESEGLGKGSRFCFTLPAAPLRGSR